MNILPNLLTFSFKVLVYIGNRGDMHEKHLFSSIVFNIENQQVSQTLYRKAVQIG
jgi:hypothetical protein